MSWRRRVFSPWPGRGPFSNLPPWQRPGWLYGPGACWWLFGRGMGWGMLNPYMGYGGVPSPAGYGYYPFGSGATLPYQQYPGLPNMPYGTGGLYPPPYNIPFMPSMRPYAWF